jgi:hypothetical protein
MLVQISLASNPQGLNEWLFCFSIVRERSSVLVETNHGGLLAESLSAEQEIVLPDEAVVSVSDSATAGFFAVLSGVRSKLVGHCKTKRCWIII